MKFNHPIILKMISVIVLVEGLFMLFPMIYSIVFGEKDVTSSFFIISIICICIGLTVFTQMKYYTLKLKSRDGFFIAIVSWLIVSIIGALPFYLANCGYTFIDSFFESAAGWTTTSCYVIDIDKMPKSLVIWKSLCHWLGGMGILFLTVSVFPVLGISGQKIAEAEINGPVVEKVATRISDTAKYFYLIYLIFTMLEFIMLSLTDMPHYDALINTLSTISTGGICSNTGGITSYMTPYVKTVITIFSILASLNFVLFFMLLHGKVRDVFRNAELRAFLGLLACSTIFIAVILTVSGTYGSFFSALSDSVFHTVSFGSTSGYAVTDYTSWPTACKVILLMLIFIGGCSASTSGSLKVIRVVVGFKLVLRGLYKRIHPQSIKPIMISNRPVSTTNASSITVFILMYFAVYIFSSLVLSIENLDMETTLSASLSAFSNTGSGFGKIGMNGNFSVFSEFGRLYSALLMIAGRLEIYPVIIMFSRSYWNPDRARS